MNLDIIPKPFGEVMRIEEDDEIEENPEKFPKETLTLMNIKSSFPVFLRWYKITMEDKSQTHEVYCGSSFLGKNPESVTKFLKSENVTDIVVVDISDFVALDNYSEAFFDAGIFVHDLSYKFFDFKAMLINARILNGLIQSSGKIAIIGGEGLSRAPFLAMVACALFGQKISVEDQIKKQFGCTHFSSFCDINYTVRHEIFVDTIVRNILRDPLVSNNEIYNDFISE